MRRAWALALCVLLVATAAAAEDTGRSSRGYVGVEGGLGVYNSIDPRLPGVGDTGFEVGAAATLRAGMQWRDHIRFDGQLTWQGVSPDELAGRLDVAAATANVYYDLGDRDAWVRPYLGVGLGVAGGWLRSDLPSATGPLASRSGVGMAYLIAGGGRFPITERLTLSCAWHFLGTVALIDDELGGTIDPSMHAFMVGLHHSF